MGLGAVPLHPPGLHVDHLRGQGRSVLQADPAHTGHNVRQVVKICRHISHHIKEAFHSYSQPELCTSVDCSIYRDSDWNYSRMFHQSRK